MKTLVMNAQQNLNGRTFDALPIGATFCIVARGSYRLIERYAKVAADRVESITDNRQWQLGQTEIPNSNIAVVPDGSRSVMAFVA